MKRFAPLFLLLTACSQSVPRDGLVCIQIQDRNGLTETISSPERLVLYDETDFLASQPYKKVLRVFREGGKNLATITTYHSNGQIWQFLEAKEMRAHGVFREWFPNGQLKIEATVIGGTADLTPGAEQTWLFDDVSRVYDEAGHLIAEIPYEKGELEGESRYYNPNGRLERSVPYHLGLLHGDLLSFSEEGELISRSRFEKGVQEGKSFGFWADRSPAWVETHHEGILLSACYWDTKGDLVASIEEGNGWKALFAQNILSQLIEYQSGIAEGQVKTYYEDGSLCSTHLLRNGKKQGEEIQYSREGQPKLMIPWDEDRIHGTVKTWYPNGRLESQREMCRNEKMGVAYGWYADGSLMFREEYEHDQLVQGQYYKRGETYPISLVLNGTGTATLFDETGALLQKVSYRNRHPVEPE